MRTDNANAKLNLFLAVKGRRPDGYHLLEMLNVPLDLADEVSLEENSIDDPELIITGDLSREEMSSIPSDSRNLAHRAAVRLAKKLNRPPAFRISLAKRIPAGAGLGGGSSDAAAVLRLIGGPKEAIDEVALGLGADVPYCVYNRPAIVRGIGEIIVPVTYPKGVNLVVVNPGFPVATREIFEAYDSAPVKEDDRFSAARTAEAFRRGDRKEIAASLYNDLEPVTCHHYPKVKEILAGVRETGAFAARMTGSGSTVFGVYQDESRARGAAAEIASDGLFARYCRVKE